MDIINLGSSETGVECVMSISTKQKNIIPHVKWLFNKNNNAYFSVTISATPEVIYVSKGMSSIMVAKHKDTVMVFVKLNYNELLDFWNNGTTLTYVRL